MVGDEWVGWKMADGGMGGVLVMNGWMVIKLLIL